MSIYSSEGPYLNYKQRHTIRQVTESLDRAQSACGTLALDAALQLISRAESADEARAIVRALRDELRPNYLTPRDTAA